MSKEVMAFPGSGSKNDGMTLRDYFAAKYMASAKSNPECINDLQDLAVESYKMADAMLAARGQ